jgi:hypothetical protein
VARWGKGEATVTQLIGDRHLQRVAADSDTAISLLAFGETSRRQRSAHRGRRPRSLLQPGL